METMTVAKIMASILGIYFQILLLQSFITIEKDNANQKCLVSDHLNFTCSLHLFQADYTTW